MKDIKLLFEKQVEYSKKLRLSDAKSRLVLLRKLKIAIQSKEEELYQALYKDLGKNRFEADITEVIFTYNEIDFAIKKLKKWMRPKRVAATFANFFSRNFIRYEPKGTCLIIAPWNYPFQLVMSPLISAIAAGNCCIVKPSEISEASAAIISNLINECFEPEHIKCIEGDAETAKELLKLPFDHIFYTGNTQIGKIVMESAAKNLSTVTLELGGKSPTIIDESANLAIAAKKIAWGKLLNAGQTCIAPDYVLVPVEKKEEFIGLFKNAIKELFYNSRGDISPKHYGKIINLKHFNRLKKLADDAINHGARIPIGGKFDQRNLIIEPIILTDLPQNTTLLEEEIFGPILPLISYTNLQVAIDSINAQAKPLALYIFSNNKKNIKHIIQSTSTGGVCINDVLIHIANPNLPFGGVGNSGMGSCHGFYGFKTFSHERSIVYQSSINFSSLIFPPYQGKNWILKLLRKIG